MPILDRIHPFELQNLDPQRFANRQKSDEFYRELIHEVEVDEHARSEWLTRQERYYQRIHCRLFRNTDWPWPRASDVVMPTISMTVDRIVASITRMIFTNPLLMVEATNPSESRQAMRDTLYLNWQLLKRSQGFKQQIIRAAYSVAAQGSGVVKIYWDFATADVERAVDMMGIPARYGQLFEALFEQATNAVRNARPLADASPTQQEVELVRDFVNQGVARQLTQDYGVDPDDDNLEETISRVVAGLEGKTRIAKFRTREVTNNNIRVVHIRNENFIPARGTCDLQDAPRITERLHLTPEVFKQRARDHDWDSRAVREVLKHFEGQGGRSKDTKHAQAEAEGVHRSGWGSFDGTRADREGVRSADSSRLITILVIHQLHEFREVPEKAWCVVAPNVGDGHQVLKAMRPQPYFHGMWPYVQIRFEEADHNFYDPRGTPEMLDDVDITITKTARAKLNNLDLLGPAWAYRLGSEINPGTFRYVPGEMFPVLQRGDLEPLQVPDRTLPNEREELGQLQWAERIMGSVSNTPEPGTVSDSPTATEIRTRQSNSNLVLGHRGFVVNIGLSEIYKQVHHLCHQFASDEEYALVTGSPMQRRTAVELQRNFPVTAVGTMETTDPVLEAQKAFGRVQALLQIVQLTGGMLDGTHQIMLSEAIVRWLERENLLDASAIVRELTPEEQQAIAERQQRREALMEAAQTNQPLTPEELSEFINENKKNVPFGGRQKIITQGGTQPQGQPVNSQ